MENQNTTLYEYTNQLSHNLSKALKDTSVLVSRNRISIYKVGKVLPDLKQWLYDLLESLPDIVHPLETVEFVVYENSERNLMTSIPSESDI